MSIVLDALTVIILVTIIYISYKKGLIRSLVELLGYFVALIAAYFLSIPLGDWLNRQFVGRCVKGTVESHLKAKGEASSRTVILDIANGLPQAVSKTFSSMGGAFKAAGDKAAGDIAGAIASPIALLLSRGIAFFAILAVCMLLIGLVARFSDILRHIPLVGTANGLGGALIGVIKAGLALLVFSTLIAVFTSFFAISKNPPLTASQIGATHIYKYVQNINPLTGMLLKK